MENYFDYLYTKELHLNLDQLNESTDRMHELILMNFSHLEDNNEHGLVPTSKLFHHYNFLLYPFPQIHELYTEIQTLYNKVEPNRQEDMFVQCWLNVYRRGQFIDWHKHWPENLGVWHGFYCLDVEPDSSTYYKIPIDDDIKEIEIKSKNNLLVLGKSDGDVHKSSEWNEDKARITIAFDIVPRQHINPYGELNHWMPI